MQTTFCLYVLMLLSIGVGVCHGVDGLDIPCPVEDVGSPVHNNDSHLSNDQWHQDASYMSPKAQNMHIKPAQTVRSVLPTSQPDLRTDRHKSTRPTSQPDLNTSHQNNPVPTTWCFDFLLSQLKEGFDNQTSILTQNISGPLTAIAETVQEGFGKQTNDTQITSDQLVALAKTVHEGFAKQTNDTQNTSDQLTKTHALVDTGLQNLTIVMSQMTDHLDTHLKNISQLCVSKSTCDPCNCSDNAKNNDQQAHCTTPKSCLTAHFQSSSQSMWLVFGFLAVFTYYTTQSSRTKKTKVDGTKTKLQNIESIVERINGQTNQLTVEVQTYKQRDAELERNAKLLQLHMRTKQSKDKFEDFDQVLAIQRLAENRQAMLRDKLLENKLKIWRHFDKQITWRLFFNAWNYTRRLHANLQICINKWASCVERENSTLNVLKRNFGAWREFSEEKTITAQINLGMIEKMQEMNVHNFNVLQHIKTIIPDVNAIREQYEQELTMLQKAIANTARRRRARSIMYASFFVLFLCVAGYIAAMLNSGTLTWPASIDGAAFLMYNDTVKLMNTQKLSTQLPDWPWLNNWFIEKIQFACEFAIMCLALMFCIWLIGLYYGTFQRPFNGPTNKSSDESVETNKAAATSKQEGIEDADRASSKELKNETKTIEHSGGNVQQSQGESDSKTPVENKADQQQTQTTSDPQIAKAAATFKQEGIEDADPASSKELKNKLQTNEQPVSDAQIQKKVQQANEQNASFDEDDSDQEYNVCFATTRKGNPCRNPAQEGSSYCWRHDPNRPKKTMQFASPQTLA